MDAGQRRIDVLGLVALDLADEAQGQVQIFRRHPARTGQAGTEIREPAAQVFGRRNGYKESHGWQQARHTEGAWRAPEND